MVTFSMLNKGEKEVWLPRLFDLLYENMKDIAPSGMTCDQEKAAFLANVSPALDKAPRQILLCFVDGELAGYVQYYVRGDLLMVEELQLRREYHRTLLFGQLCRPLIRSLPPEIRFVEAYADRRNKNSMGIMEKLGMETLPEPGPYAHLRGPAEQARKRFDRRT